MTGAAGHRDREILAVERQSKRLQHRHGAVERLSARTFGQDQPQIGQPGVIAADTAQRGKIIWRDRRPGEKA